MTTGQGFILLLFLFSCFFIVSPNSEGDALMKMKDVVTDPNYVLASWDSSLPNPCIWHHIGCDDDNSVTRVDLGNANLSGELVPQLGSLTNLQYLELYSNNISGKIPPELGSLTNILSLDLFENQLSGPVPDTLGNLTKLRSLRLNNNTLSGAIPYSLTAVYTLQVLDLSSNNLSGVIPVNGSFSYFSPKRFLDNPNLIYAPLPLRPHTQNPPSSSGEAMGETTVAECITIGAALFVVVHCLVVFPRALMALYSRRRMRRQNPKVEYMTLPKRLSLREILAATDNFSHKNVLGRGRYGKVYRGCLVDGSLVAVKRLVIGGGEFQYRTTELDLFNLLIMPSFFA